jgi:hypothetical protein
MPELSITTKPHKKAFQTRMDGQYSKVKRRKISTISENHDREKAMKVQTEKELRVPKAIECTYSHRPYTKIVLMRTV